MIQYAVLTTLNGSEDPRTRAEAMRSPQAPQWLSAEGEEISGLKEQKVFELVPCPPDRKPTGSRWAHKTRYNADGSVELLRACLVAKGFSQKPHLDYTETFAPVTKFPALRAVLSIAASLDMEIDALHISQDFLYGDLEEEICRSQRAGTWQGELGQV